MDSLASRGASILAVGAAVLLSSAVAHAGGPMRLEDGQTLRWGEPAEPLHLELLGNTLNAATVYPEELSDAVVAGLQSWSEASEGLITFDYWQGPELETYPAALENDGVSTIFFASAAGPELGLSRSTAAYAQLWLDPDTGLVDEVDIVLNDGGYAFTADPEEVDLGAARPVLLLRSVIVHELGHAFGLEHSGVYDSTMFTWSWPGQDSLSCDDVAALRRHMGLGDDALVSGRIVDQNAEPVAAAHVLAVRADGTVVGSALADADGRYAFDGLEAGRYAFIVEPFFAGAEALSPGYTEAGDVCGGSPFGRRVIGDALGVEVRGDVSLGETTVGCEGELAGPFLPLGLSPETAPSLGDEAFELIEVPASEERFLWLEDVQGPLRVRTTTHGVYSPISTKLTLYDADGVQVPTSATRPRVPATEGTEAEWDTELVLLDLPRGDYLLELGADRLIDTLYLRGDLYLDTRPFALLSIHAGAEPSPGACEVPTPDPSSYVTPTRPAPAPTDDESAQGCSVGGGSPWALAVLVLLGAWRRQT